jgi:hypothetical protein
VHRAWRVCALSIQRLEGSRPRLRRMRALWKLNGVKGRRRGASGLCDGAQQMARRARKLAIAENGAKRVYEEARRRDLFGDKAIGGGACRDTQKICVGKSCFMGQR